MLYKPNRTLRLRAMFQRTRTDATCRATLALCALLIAGCAASTSTPARQRESPATTIAPHTTATATTRAIPDVSGHLIATATKDRVDIYEDPSAPTPRLVLPNPWMLNGSSKRPIVQVFRVVQRRPDGWVQVDLPQRPNGQTGWIPAGEVRLSQTLYRVEVSLAAHVITVFNASKVVYRGPVATGASNTPTPTGRYYLRVLIKNSGPGSVYGPFAFGLSAHSDALTTFNGSDAEIGLHGNNDVTALGRSVSHGCIRIDNTAIVRLAEILPLGTTIEIVT